MGTIDQHVRIGVGLALVAFAFQNGTPIQSWHWAGLIGLVFHATASFKRCPLYRPLGMTTCEARQ
jgi:hypothetical protein